MPFLTCFLSPGYNQGVLGTVSGTPGFIDMAQIGANGVVTDTTKQGGLAAAYYFGAMWGCFIGGKEIFCLYSVPSTS
jgi:hypothetical protein